MCMMDDCSKEINLGLVNKGVEAIKNAVLMY
jgi:hypothetical protein